MQCLGAMSSAPAPANSTLQRQRLLKEIRELLPKLMPASVRRGSSDKRMLLRALALLHGIGGHSEVLCNVVDLAGADSWEMAEQVRGRSNLLPL